MQLPPGPALTLLERQPHLVSFVPYIRTCCLFWEHESCFISKGVNPARDCFPLMRPLNFPLATIFEVVENLNRIPLPGRSCLCWDLLQEVKKGIAEICECACTWWLKSRCVVATGELFSFIDVLVLKVRWRGRGIICLL